MSKLHRLALLPRRPRRPRRVHQRRRRRRHPRHPERHPALRRARPGDSAGSFGEIEHATGATDVLLRYENGGGFVPPSFLATEAPIFTLYGDGTVVFRNPAHRATAAASAPSSRSARSARCKLTEDQIQEVLAFALGDGGLGVARASYENQMISDASTSVFTVDAGGIKKTVSVYALGMDIEGIPDMPPPARPSSGWPSGSATSTATAAIATERLPARPATAAS